MGIPKAKLRLFATDTPTRVPVNDPGPVATWMLVVITERRTLLNVIGCAMILIVAGTITDRAYQHHQLQIEHQQLLINDRLSQAEVTPTPFKLDSNGQVLGQSLDRHQQYQYLQEHVTNWDTPCFRQAIQAAKQYQPRSSAFDYLVSKLWSCAE